MASSLIASVGYVDAPAAIDFLCHAFGFSRHAVHADDADPGLIHHAQLTLGGGMLMLGSARPGEAQARYGWKTPAEAGGVTSAVYVADPDAYCVTARAAAARIITEPADNEGSPAAATAPTTPKATSGASAAKTPGLNSCDHRACRTRPGLIQAKSATICDILAGTVHPC